MSSSFRRPFTVLTESPGTYVAGLWQSGVRTFRTVLASVQPVKSLRSRDEQDLQSLTEGRRKSDRVKIYTDDVLLIAGEGLQSDLIVFNGDVYEIVLADSYQSQVINHQRYEAIRRRPFTSTADWINGTLPRDEP